MVNVSRRKLLLGATGSVVSLAGCGSTSSQNSNEPSNNTPQDLQQTPENTEDNTQSQIGSIELQYDGPDRDEPVETYDLVNSTSSMANIVTISSGQFDNPYDMEYRLSPGENRSIRIDEDAPEPSLAETGTWTESEYQLASGETDVTATPTAFVGSDDADIAEQISYSVPNPTDIDASNVREAEVTVNNGAGADKSGRPGINASADGLSFSSASPVWTSTFSVELSTTSDSEQFSFQLDTEPSIDVSIDDIDLESEILRNPTITVTARSAIPVIEANMVIYASGPSFSFADKNRYTDGIRLSGEGRTLVDTSVGQGRIGRSRTITLDGQSYYSESVDDFPLEEDDTINILVFSAAKDAAIRYPITYVEQPIQDLVE